MQRLRAASVTVLGVALAGSAAMPVAAYGAGGGTTPGPVTHAGSQVTTSIVRPGYTTSDAPTSSTPGYSGTTSGGSVAPVAPLSPQQIFNNLQASYITTAYCNGTFGGMVSTLTGSGPCAGGTPTTSTTGGTAPTQQVKVVNATVLAQKATKKLQLQTATVHTAPAPPHHEVVGVAVWMWVNKAEWNPLSTTVKLGPTSVTVSAAPDHVSWDMGDGNNQYCYSPGQPWVKGMTDAAQSDCTYTYRTISSGQPGGVFHITARIGYNVSWTCTGRCTSHGGSLGILQGPPGGGYIKSVQRQTVVVN